MKKNIILNYINMDRLIKIFGRNFLYGGLMCGFLLTLIDLIKNSTNNIAFYAFLSGSFFIFNLFQYYYVKQVSKQNIEQFLIHSMIGGILWVGLASLLYYLHKSRLNDMTIIISILLTMILISIIYFYLLKNLK